MSVSKEEEGLFILNLASAVICLLLLCTSDAYCAFGTDCRVELAWLAGRLLSNYLLKLNQRNCLTSKRTDDNID